MSKNIPKKFCRLSRYLQIKDKVLYQVFDDLCLFSLFRTRGTRGITFLYPDNKAYREKIINKAYSVTPEVAIKMIKSLVLMDHLPKLVNFQNKKDDIPNALGQKLEVDKASTTSVTIIDAVSKKPTLSLKLDEKYVPLRDDEKSVVYILMGKGELSTSSAGATMKYAQGKPVSGGYTGGNEADKKWAANFTETEYSSNKTHGKEIYKYMLTGIFNYVIFYTSEQEQSLLISNIYKGLCASARATFYTIVRPHSDNLNDDFLPSSVFKFLKENWVTSRPLQQVAYYTTGYEDIKTQIINRHLKVESPSASETKRVTNTDTQKQLLQNTTNPNTYRDVIMEAYGSDMYRLKKDLLTIYCYLSSCYEFEERSLDDTATYYDHCFLHSIRNLFNDGDYILQGTTDLAFNITLYGNLLKSDAFLYIPMRTTATETNSEYKVLYNRFPDPTNPTELFTVTRSHQMSMFGGGTGGSASESFYGGYANK